MLSLEHALEQILSLVHPLASEAVPLSSAAGRVLAESIVSPINLPGFDNSAMDGYAVRAQDLPDASLDNPVPLRLIGQVAAGEVFSGALSAGECVRLFTGSPLPAGADAVVMQEDTRTEFSQPDRLLMLQPARPWEHVRFAGEDVKVGALALQEGERLTAGQAGLLAALGFSQVPVRRKPLIGLLATGSELREPGEPLGPGQIYESNRTTLALLSSQAGAQPKVYALVPDQLEATQSALAAALSECDAVITSGGVSVGEMDLVKAAFQELGGELAFWRVAMKPGKPFVLGTCQGKLLFGLPGNPVSAFVTFLLLVRPALLKFQGASVTQLPTRPGVLAEALVNAAERRHFVRVMLDREGQVRPAGTQASHLLHSLARANGLLDVPPDTTLPAGKTVGVLSWD